MALTINLTGVEPAFAKNTAFNKNFGTSSGDILLLGSTSVASKVLVTDSNNKVKTSSTTETQLSYLDATSSIQTQLGTKEATANKDATGGYVGLTLFKINFKNVLNTFTSFFTNSNTDARTYTFPDKNGTVAMTSDITGTNSGTNTGDQDLSGLAPIASPTFTGTVVLPSTTSIGTVSDIEIGYLDGVTQSIQPALTDARDLKYAAYDNTDKTITGTTAETYLAGLLVPTLTANSSLDFLAIPNKTGTAGTIIWNLYYNTTNNMAGTPVKIGTYTHTAVQLYGGQFIRRIVYKNSLTSAMIFRATVAAANDFTGNATAMSLLAIDLSAKYLVITASLTNAADTAILSSFQLMHTKP